MWAYNTQTKKIELESIQHVIITTDNDLVDLTLSTQAPAKKLTSETIHTNQKHPFLVAGKGFVPVGKLHLGMQVVEANGQLGVVTGWKSVPDTQTMYNLTVTQDHTYTVGAEQWVVHNVCLAGDVAQGGLEFTEYGAQRANERGFTPEVIDRIVRQGKKAVTWEATEDPGMLEKRLRFSDGRGNTVVTNEFKERII